MEKTNNPTVAIAMIARNEEACIERALESVKEADNIYLCDTGSTDATMNIARKYTDNVCGEYKWEDSFCKARNHVKSHVKEDWILSLDADEYVPNFQAVRDAVEIAEKNGWNAVNVLQISESDGQTNVFPRLFKNSPAIVWHGDAHNWHTGTPVTIYQKDGQVIANIGNPTEEEAQASIVRLVYGHSLTHFSDPDRTLRILEKSVKEGTAGARELYYLGREYYYRSRWTEATYTLGKYVQQTNHLAEKADGFLMMARCYWAQRMPDDARDACAQALIINPDFKEALLFMAELSWPRQAARWRSYSELADNTGVLFNRTDKVDKEESKEIKPLKLFLAPHNDDEALFGSYIIMREKCHVVIVTDSHIQPNRGEKGCSADERWQESCKAADVLKCPIMRLGLRDDTVTEKEMEEALVRFVGLVEVVYAPALQGGNVHHDMVNRVAKKLFGDKVKEYTTYNPYLLYTVGNTPIAPTEEEIKKKNEALDCYQSQLRINASHFEAVFGKPEWLL